MDSRERYRSLLAARPALARNPKGGITVVSGPSDTARIEAVMAERFAAQGLPREWARAGIFYEDPYIILLRDAVIFPDGKPGLYHRVIARHDDPTGVAVLGRYDGKIVLVRHFRHPSRTWHLEIPRGAVGADEDPAHVAHLEISEEIGGTIRSLRRLGLLHGASALMR
jgi:ADP-ribose pyrophosphatase